MKDMLVEEGIQRRGSGMAVRRGLYLFQVVFQAQVLCLMSVTLFPSLSCRCPVRPPAVQGKEMSSTNTLEHFGRHYVNVLTCISLCHIAFADHVQKPI